MTPATSTNTGRRDAAEADLNIGLNDRLSVIVDDGLNHCPATSVWGWAVIDATVVDLTTAAVCLAAWTPDGRSVTSWLPRRALTRMHHEPLAGTSLSYHKLRLASWFRAHGWTARFLEITPRASRVPLALIGPATMAAVPAGAEG